MAETSEPAKQEASGEVRGGEPHAGGGAARRQADLTRLHRKATAALYETLLPGEPALAAIQGGGGSAIVGTDRRVLVFKTGVRSGLPFDHRLKSFEYESVLRIDLHRVADRLEAAGVVVVHAPLKMSICARYWALESDDPWTARNAIPVVLPDRRVERGVATLATLLGEFRAAPSAEPLLEHLEELEQQPSIKPVVAPGPSKEGCPRCGTELGSGWQFCPRCGAPSAGHPPPGRPLRQRRLSSS